MLEVAVLVGSLRKASYSRNVANAVAKLTPSMRFRTIDIGNVSFFSEDMEALPPRTWTELREQIQAADAILFVTPEYVRSVPGVLKNAIEICGRPWREGAMQGKPATIISTAVGSMGGFGANHHLRQSLASLDMPTMGQPEAYVGNMAGLFDAQGQLVNPDTREFLAAFGIAFERFIRGQIVSRATSIAA